MDAAIDLDTKLILDVALFRRRGTDLAAAFLHRTENYQVWRLVHNGPFAVCQRRKPPRVLRGEPWVKY